MGWVRQEGDDWLVFDDADVSPCKTEDIMNLKGGGDWHMATSPSIASRNRETKKKGGACLHVYAGRGGRGGKKKKKKT